MNTDVGWKPMAGVILMGLAGGLGACRAENPAPDPLAARRISLTAPRIDGTMSLEAAISARRSVRRFSPDALTLEQIGQLLWSAQGLTDPRGWRAAPSAGATYPLELYVLLADGVYRYHPREHRIEQVAEGDRRSAVWQAGLRQDALRTAPAVFVFAATPERTERRYGSRATRYIHMEVGHAAQNLSLQAVALGLGSVMIGAMEDDRVHAAAGLPAGQEVLYLVPVGYP